MKNTTGEIEGIILDNQEIQNIHLWLEDYFETLKGYREFDYPEKQKNALEERIKQVREFCDNILFFATN